MTDEYSDDTDRFHIAVVVGITAGFGLAVFGFQTGNLLLTIMGAIVTLGTAVSAKRAVDTECDRDA